MLSPFLIWWFAISTHIGFIISSIGPSSLLRPIAFAAIGYDHTTNLIWLIGGSGYKTRSLISFNLSIWNDTNPFLDHGYPLSYGVSCLSQIYVQTEAVVYVVGYRDTKLLVYNISTKIINIIATNPSSVTLLYDACLASIGDWIIYTYFTHTYILTISTQSWKLSGTPIITEGRYQHACVIEPNGGYLYVIGGVGLGMDYMDTILKLYVKDIPNIEKYTFTTLTDTLSRTKSSMAAVLHGTDIFVAGGWGRDEIDVIDTRTDSVIFWGKLHEASALASPIIVGTRLYIFGGFVNGTGEVDYWQWFDMFSTNNLFIHGSFRKKGRIFVTLLFFRMSRLTVSVHY